MKETNRRSAAQRKARQRKLRNRRIAMTVALVLVVALASIGGTIAWLTDTTTPVTNTFTAAGIDITLIETKNPDNSENKDENQQVKPVTNWSAPLVPGKSYSKNPVVTVEDTTDVDVYLFVKFDEIGNSAAYLSYTSTLTAANGWTKGDGSNIPANVWYRIVNTTDPVKSWHLLADDTVTVKNTVTKADMQYAANAKLEYTAYAIQTEGMTGDNDAAKAADAWNKISTTP